MIGGRTEVSFPALDADGNLVKCTVGDVYMLFETLFLPGMTDPTQISGNDFHWTFTMFDLIMRTWAVNAIGTLTSTVGDELAGDNAGEASFYPTAGVGGG